MPEPRAPMGQPDAPLDPEPAAAVRAERGEGICAERGEGTAAERPKADDVACTAEEIIERVVQEGLLRRGGPVVVMLSGGRDSVCLIDLACSICSAENVQALHVNYGLRAQADEDEAHCEQLCERVGVRLTAHRVSRPAKAGNLQAWAREVRYAAARQIAEQKGALIAVGQLVGMRWIVWDGRNEMPEEVFEQCMLVVRRMLGQTAGEPSAVLGDATAPAHATAPTQRERPTV